MRGPLIGDILNALRVASSRGIIENGAFFTDPRLMHQAFGTRIALNNGAFEIYDNTTGRFSDEANFFTRVGVVGTAVDTNWTANSAKTILSSSNGGFCSAIIGPVQATLGDTCKFRLTLDGVLYPDINYTAGAAAERPILGAVAYNGTYTSAGLDSQGYSDLSTDKKWSKIDGATVSPHILSVENSRALGRALLAWKTSILLEIEISTNLTTTTNQERQAGIVYQLR